MRPIALVLVPVGSHAPAPPRAAVLGDAGGNDTSIDHLTGETRRQWLMLEQDLLDAGIEPRILSTLRTCAKQNELYGIGRSEGDSRKIVTQAQGCRSWHVLGRAIDVILYRDGVKAGEEAYQIMGALAKARGWKWGGDFPGFPDLVHVEWHPGLTTEQVCPDVYDCETTQERALSEPDAGDESGGFPWLPFLGVATVAGVVWALRR